MIDPIIENYELFCTIMYFILKLYHGNKNREEN